VILHVLRHAIAEDSAPGGDDRARRLTPRGRAKFRASAAGLRALGVEIDVLLTSPLVRAVETATLVAETWGGRLEPRELPALATGVPPAETLRALRPFARHGNVMIVGHEPGLSGLVALLLTGSPEGMSLTLKKGGLASLELEALQPHGGAMLRSLLTPRQLRRLRR
jgi:phosphohistidine phosphatase